MLGLRKANFKTKIIRLKNLTMPKTVKGGTLRFFNIHSVAKFRKIGARLEKFSKKNKKMRIFNSLIVPKNLKEGTLWDFLTFVLLQNTKKMKGGIFGDMKKIAKSHKAEITCTKNFSQGRDSNPRPSAWQTSKNPN